MNKKEYSRIWRANNIVGTFPKKLRRLLCLAKHRAKKKGIEFSITEDDFDTITHCPLQGMALDFSKVGRGTADNSPTIDRINPAAGYVPGNVWVISAKANRMKSDATLEELELLVFNLRIKLGK